MSCRALACRDARRAVAAVTLIEAFARSCLEARLEWRIGSPWPFWRDDRWVDKGPIGEGESASIRVQNDFNAMIGVSKPGLSKAAETDHCRAAHEKLAFDLAYNAELPVGAVVLWGEAMPPQYKRGRSISSWTFPQAINWSDANRRGLVTPARTTTVDPGEEFRFELPSVATHDSGRGRSGDPQWQSGSC